MSDKDFDETKHRDDAASVATATYVAGTEAERKLLRKIDLHIIPCVWLLYTMSYLDRANIGNAEAGGMADQQYSIILLVFFISYVLFEVPANMILTRVRPSLWLSGLCFIWGLVAASMALGQTWSAIAGIRFCLGVCEAGFAPGVAFYLSSWYKRNEIAKRYSIYYTATAVSGAFSGLLAGVITQNLDGARGIAGWRWLLLIEGVMSSFVACFTWYVLADYPGNTRWLSADERILAAQRLASEDIGDTSDAAHQDGHLKSLKKGFTDWRILALSICYMLATGSQTIQYFIPQLVGRLGYTGFTKQYMTIPVYAVAFCFILTFCFVSDFRRERCHYISIAAIISTISFIICVAVPNEKVKYAFLCFAVGGVYASAPLILMLTVNTISHPAEKRAIAVAIVNGLGNSASIYGSFLWPSRTGPRFVQGFATTIAFLGLLAVGAQVLRYLFAKYPYGSIEENKTEMENRRHLGA